MTINSLSKEVFQVTRNNGGNCEFGIVKFPKLEKPRIARLLPSGSTTNKYWDTRQEQAGQFRSAEAIKILTGAISKIAARDKKLSSPKQRIWVKELGSE